MQTFVLEKIYDDNVCGQKANETDYDIIFDSDVKVIKPDGKLLCILLKNSIPKIVAETAWPSLKKMHITSLNRGMASGEERIQYNNTNQSIPVESGIIGFFERTPRMPYCRACAWNLENPEGWNSLYPLIENTNALFENHAPKQYKTQMKVAEKTSKDFIISGTPFTTLTVNRNFRTGYHRDAGNLQDGISCMTVIQEGFFTGANLVFPKFRAAVKLRGLDTIIFDPHEVHGNTPLLKASKNSIRCSVVYYYREKISDCGSAEEELERVKNRHQGEQLHRVIRKSKNVEA